MGKRTVSYVNMHLVLEGRAARQTRALIAKARKMGKARRLLGHQEFVDAAVACVAVVEALDDTLRRLKREEPAVLRPRRRGDRVSGRDALDGAEVVAARRRATGGS